MRIEPSLKKRDSNIYFKNRRVKWDNLTKVVMGFLRTGRKQSLRSLTRKHVEKSIVNTNQEEIISEGVHTCLNGESFTYKVTNYDIQRREFTGNRDLLEKLNDNLIEPFEVSRLLEQLYGEYPENTL
jgi:hypothetical protein